jgi:periplasmic divalent cation tolerance protein
MTEDKTGHVVVFCTAPDMKEAERIGEAVVTERLAACCNIVPGLKSIYTWKGKLMNEDEVLCILKTRKTLFKALEKRIKELHGYEVPEVIAVDITSGLESYLDWIDEVTGD